MRPTILIVDDHGTFRATARALLEFDGFEVVGEAPDGGAGMAAARALKPDVVLLDVRLPDTDGFTIAACLTAGQGGPAVIVTSSSDDPLYPARARQWRSRLRGQARPLRGRRAAPARLVTRLRARAARLRACAW